MRYNFTQEQLENAYDTAKSASGAAKLLHIKLDTYRKYAKYYGCYKTSKSGNGVSVERKFVENPNTNIHYFDNIDSTDKAYILGFLLADGTVHCNSLKLNISTKDREILEYICEKLNICNTKILDSVRPYTYKNTIKKFYCSSLCITSKHLVHTLIGYGLVANRVKDNHALFGNIPDFMMLPCLSGYIDGNGSFSKNNRNISITSSDNACRFISDYLRQFDVMITHIRQHDNFSEVYFSGNEKFIQAYLASNEFLLSRKRSRAEFMLHKIKNPKHNTNSKQHSTNTCIDCGKVISDTAIRCRSCAVSYIHSSSCKRPSKKQLLSDLLCRNFSVVSKKYNVSDNAVRRWCKFYSLPYSTKQLKSMTDDEICNL